MPLRSWPQPKLSKSERCLTLHILEYSYRTSLMDSTLQQQFDHFGYLLGHRDGGSQISELFSIVKSLKKSALRIQRLRPTSQYQARANTLSHRYGTGAFPPHTDFAALEIPPRYVALACPFERSASTCLYYTRVPELSFTLEDEGALFRVCRARTFYTTRLVTRIGSNQMVRFNRDCLTPLNKTAEKVSQLICEEWHPTQAVDWSRTIWILFDNWRLLHGRGPSKSKYRGWLWRIAIWDT